MDAFARSGSPRSQSGIGDTKAPRKEGCDARGKLRKPRPSGNLARKEGGASRGLQVFFLFVIHFFSFVGWAEDCKRQAFFFCVSDHVGVGIWRPAAAQKIKIKIKIALHTASSLPGFSQSSKCHKLQHEAGIFVDSPTPPKSRVT